MKVRCIASELTPKQKQELGLANSTHQYYQEVGTVHTVLGMSWHLSPPFGVMLQLPHRYYILPIPMCLFEIIDPRPSRHWIIQQAGTTGIECQPIEFYAASFAERVSDFEPEACEIYHEVCFRLEHEFD
ncbi:MULTISPECIES: hypothetical protein [unclassified Paludibacterium]|uniref:hypothetical protein n=1 Tax=unclassified Paludibacterium TaxID=2618429 RepID=UPI001C04179B|nr:hypothetical protein [Paludibacterium sp. B53371]BEV73099.1 hypothetical protein THUN1379_25810 [Paludibacterium sp. THUN1379]